MQHLNHITDGDIVKTEAHNRLSRDEVTLASGSGARVTGTVLGQVTSTGKFKPFAPAAEDGTQIASAILLQYTDAAVGDKTVVVLARHAQVVLQALVWPEGITATQQKAALKALEASLIVARNGV